MYFQVATNEQMEERATLALDIKRKRLIDTVRSEGCKVTLKLKFRGAKGNFP